MSDRTAARTDLSGIFGPDLITEGIRAQLGEVLRLMVETELDERLAAIRYARAEGRTGYRNGTKSRTLHTSLGSTQFEMPRARVNGAEGSQEWQSTLIPKYERRARDLDAVLVGMYFAGTNLRRIRRSLKPLLAEAPLDKNVVSRLVGRLAEHVEAWKSRKFEANAYLYLYLDATYLKIRVFRKVGRVPVLVVLGVRQDGQKEVLAMEAQVKESAPAWKEVLEDLVRRGLTRPILAIVDGHAGLRAALDEVWPKIQVQRCTVHKLRNIQTHCPVDAYPQVKSDYHRIVDATTPGEAKEAYRSFVKRWEKELPKVAKSLEEAGEELLTFHDFPSEQWRSLKTTNPIERLNLEFKRRVKTQCSLPSEKSAILLLYGLLISGQIRFRKIDGWETLVQVVAKAQREELLKKAAS